MKKFLKGIPKTSVGRVFIALLVVCYIALLRLTCRVHITNGHIVRDLKQQKQPFIITLWHGRLLMMPLLFPKGVKAKTLISEHNDGIIVKHTAAAFAFKTVAGSSTNGGAKAFKEMIRSVKDGISLFITPDGPKGPRGTFQAGAAEVARMTGAPIVATSISASPAKFARSWDKFMLPKLFGDIYIHYGEPMYIDKKSSEAEREEFYDRCKNMLNALEENTDSEANS